VADIFRAHGDAYRRSHALSTAQRRTMRDIEACRTAVLGGHLDVCGACGHEVPAYNSCRNRHCPKCQALAQDEWLRQRQARILPTHYFHVVFTVPAELRGLTLCNREVVFALLFAAASATLLELGRDPRRLGALLGFTAVLHTWTRELLFHPHLHCIVTGGGLVDGDERWVAARRRYLFPLKVIGALFRGKLLDALRRAHDDGALVLPPPACARIAPPRAFAAFLARLYRIDWLPYVKPTFAGPRQVYEYLGRYTHRTGISNRRLLAMDDRSVTFATKSGKSATVAPQEFIRRFLLHVLPARFVKIRHYGLMAAGNATGRLEVARQRLTSDAPPATAGTVAPTAPAAIDWRERLRELTGIDLSICPRCKTGRMIRRALPRVAPPPEPRDTS
jgi:predicted nucleic acid-binding Zn ribbon protein